jgi:GAF domain-containing protein
MKTDTTARFKPGRLRLFPAERPIKELWLIEPGIYRIGRDQSCDLCLDDPEISRFHLEIDARQEPWQVVDSGSKNGSRLDGRPLGCARLGESCWLSLGGVPARFERLSTSRKQHYERLNQQHGDTVNVALKKLSRVNDITGQLDYLLEAFLGLASCSRGALILAANPSSPQVAHLRGWDQFGGSQTVVQSTLELGIPSVVNDVVLEQSMAEQASIIDRPLRALVSIPLKIDDRAHGVLYAESDQPGRLFSELDVELMEALADQAVILIGLHRLGMQLSALASEHG